MAENKVAKKDNEVDPASDSSTIGTAELEEAELECELEEKVVRLDEKVSELEKEGHVR